MKTQDIVIVTDYHAKAISYRWFDQATGEERTFSGPTDCEAIASVLAEAQSAATANGCHGKVVWIMESTTGWARMQALVGEGAQFILANVLQVPMPPKARRRKTDKLDTSRLLSEYLHGSLSQAHRPDQTWRQSRRIVSLREDLVRRRTTLRNQIKAYFAHETWHAIQLGSAKGMAQLQQLIASLPASDQFFLQTKVDELEALQTRLTKVQAQLMQWYHQWPDAQRLDAIRGIAEVAAVSIVARIGPINRFTQPEQLIAYAGLAPGIRQSDTTSRHLSIGGGGTDKQLRHYLIEATIWAREIPRYRKTYERVETKRGRKIARIVVARMMLRSIHKMLADGVGFRATA